MIQIRQCAEEDRAALWEILKPIFRSGETYAVPPEIGESEAFQIWIEAPTETFVAVDANGRILGSYYIKPNQRGPGDHVCNCGYVVAEAARGQGVASLMCEHSLKEAVECGFRAMQYNLVVSTNEGAIRLWKKHGFEIVGTLPKCFRHPKDGYVDGFVMYKLLQHQN
jgi:L-amino acid N-acyltransferase YncA